MRINGEGLYQFSTPDALVAKIREIVGDVPALDAVAPAPARLVTVTVPDSAPNPVQPTDPSAGEPMGVTVSRSSALWVLIAGVVGLAAALTLTIEKIEILINPDYVPSCSINPVLSCGSVMITPQASAFGFPNPLIGIRVVHCGVGDRVLALPKWRCRAGTGRVWPPARCGRGVRALADLPEPVPHRRAVPVLHGGVGRDDPTARGGRLDRVAAPAQQLRPGQGSLHLALVGGGAVVTAVILLILVRFWNYWSTLI